MVCKVDIAKGCGMCHPRNRDFHPISLTHVHLYINYKRKNIEIIFTTNLPLYNIIYKRIRISDEGLTHNILHCRLSK